MHRDTRVPARANDEEEESIHGHKTALQWEKLPGIKGNLATYALIHFKQVFRGCAPFITIIVGHIYMGCSSVLVYHQKIR